MLLALAISATIWEPPLHHFRFQVWFWNEEQGEVSLYREGGTVWPDTAWGKWVNWGSQQRLFYTTAENQACNEYDECVPIEGLQRGDTIWVFTRPLWNGEEPRVYEPARYYIWWKWTAKR